MKTITAQDLKNRLGKGEVLLIDVRGIDEYTKAYIPGSHLIPLPELSMDKLPTKSLPIVLHCAAGKRSITAGEKLLAQDSSLDVYSLTGGITAWKDAGFEVKSGTS